MDNLSFSIPEVLSLIGLSQCVYLIVYISIRARQISHAGLPVLYFLVLAVAFFLDFAKDHIGEISAYYYYFQWAAWFSGPPLSVLLVIQFSQTKETLTFRDFWVLTLIPLCLILSTMAVDNNTACEGIKTCEQLQSLMNVTGLMAGAISLLVIFSKKDLFSSMRKQRQGKERYWLVFSLIFMNVFFLTVMMAHLADIIDAQQAVLMKTILGLGFAYLVSTSLLRLYPKTSKSNSSGRGENELSEDELVLAKKIEDLLQYDKVYQEATYSRLDLSRECNASEVIISKVINLHFQKSFPQLMNERRVEDAKQLLEQTKAPVKVIAEEVGFNSLPTFNRVFKDITGDSPSDYRKLIKT